MTQRLRLVFDLDGTLFDGDMDYEDPDSVRKNTRPHPTAVALVQQAYRDGHGIAYLTGRCEHIRALTQIQLNSADLPPGELVMQKAWMGYDIMAAYKATHLRRLRAHLYIGDHDADRLAAEAARVDFHHAHDWRRGIMPPLLQEVDA